MPIPLDLPTTLFILSGVQTVAVLIYMFRVAGSGKTIGTDDEIPDREEMKKYIIWKSFYMNPNDPRGWVPKTTGVGMTVNFRSWGQVKVFAALVAGSLLCALAGAAILVGRLD